MPTQSVAIDEFSGDVMHALPHGRATASLANLIDGEYVRMIECGRRPGFANKPIQLLLILAEFFVEKFDRDLAIELRVLRQIDFAHSAGADLRDDAVMRQS